MTYEFKLPDIGEGVVEGEVVRWLVKEGDSVREDQPLVEIMTDKATVEIPAPRAGVVGKRFYAEGQICPVGKVLVTIELADATATGSPEPAAPVSAPAESAGRTARHAAGGPVPDAPGGQTVGVARAGEVLATPATRKLARTLGLDIRTVAGTGRAGRITSDDVQARARQAGGGSAAAGSAGGASASSLALSPAAEPGDVRLPFRGVRKKIAERLVHSKHTAAHFTYVEEVDCTELVALRARANDRLNERLAAQAGKQQTPPKLSYLPFIIKATVEALKKFPQLNSTLDEGSSEIVQRAAHHIGLATATDSGLIVPVVRDADRKSLVRLSAEIERLAEATRSGKATREDLSGSTFTITSLGALGGLLATPIINHPEVAILGIHKIAKRPAVVGDRIVIRDMMNLSISVDHRVVDGYDAARFVAVIKAALEHPEPMLTEAELE